MRSTECTQAEEVFLYIRRSLCGGGGDRVVLIYSFYAATSYLHLHTDKFHLFCANLRLCWVAVY